MNLVSSEEPQKRSLHRRREQIRVRRGRRHRARQRLRQLGHADESGILRQRSVEVDTAVGEDDGAARNGSRAGRALVKPGSSEGRKLFGVVVGEI